MFLAAMSLIAVLALILSLLLLALGSAFQCHQMEDVFCSHSPESAGSWPGSWRGSCPARSSGRERESHSLWCPALSHCRLGALRGWRQSVVFAVSGAPRCAKQSRYPTCGLSGFMKTLAVFSSPSSRLPIFSVLC